MSKVAHAVYVRLYIDKYLDSKVLQVLLNDVNDVRNVTGKSKFMSVLQLICDKTKDTCRQMLHLKNCYDARLIAPYVAWYST